MPRCKVCLGIVVGGESTGIRQTGLPIMGEVYPRRIGGLFAGFFVCGFQKKLFKPENRLPV